MFYQRKWSHVTGQASGRQARPWRRQEVQGDLDAPLAAGPEVVLEDSLERPLAPEELGFPRSYIPPRAWPPRTLTGRAGIAIDDDLLDKWLDDGYGSGDLFLHETLNR